MNRFLYALTFFVVTIVPTLAKAQHDFFDCQRAGRDTGRSNTQQFCRALMASDYETTVAARVVSAPVQFCSVAIADSCRQEMWNELERDPSCRDEVYGFNGQSSHDKFSALVEAGCPRPEVVRCPFPNAIVHKGFWCRVPHTSRYWAYTDGVWWKFINNQGGAGDEKQYYVQAMDGAVRIVTRYDLTIVAP